jgi:hypothetical protein
MEHEFHEEKYGSLKKSKRFANKRDRTQVKNYLKGTSIEDFIEDTEDDTEYEIPYKG